MMMACELNLIWCYFKLRVADLLPGVTHGVNQAMGLESPGDVLVFTYCFAATLSLRWHQRFGEYQRCSNIAFY